VARAGAVSGQGGGTADPGEVVQDILLMLGPVLREHSIAVELDAGPVSPVRGDPAILHQVVLNLVINARDALEQVAPDRRALRIRVRDEQGGVRITVSDTGPGVPPEGWARMFQPFVTTKGPGHLGLGLAAARASLERMGGELGGHTAPGGGAVFEVVLRRGARAGRAEPAAGECAVAVAGASASADAGADGLAGAGGLEAAGAEVLVIDDDSDLVSVIGSFLRPLGYRVTTATSAAEALELAAERPFDLVLCDVGLPTQSGPDVCRELRQSGFAGRIVLMTGWDGDQVTSGQPTSDHDHLLRKPFFGADLLRAIETSLGA